MERTIDIGNEVIIWAGTFDQVRTQLKTAREKERRKKIGVMGFDDVLNRKILEKEKIDFFIPLLKGRKDKQKQRNSGFNHVMARLAKKNGTVIGILLDEIINSSSKNKTEILSRVQQNVKLCVKNKVQMKFISIQKEYKRDLYDLKALGIVLGMPTSMVKNL